MTPEDINESDTIIKAMLQSDEARADQMASQGDIVEATPPEYNVTKTFPLRGDWTQYRLAASSRLSYSSAKSPKLQSSLLSREEAGVNSAVMDAMGPLVLRCDQAAELNSREGLPSCSTLFPVDMIASFHTLQLIQWFVYVQDQLVRKKVRPIM